MSLGGLVAYGDSDDSDGETSDNVDNEEITTSETKSRLDNGGPDSGSAEAVSKEPESTLKTQKTSSSSGVIGTVDDIEDDEPVTVLQPLSQTLKLPPPKHSTGEQANFFGTDSLPSKKTSGDNVETRHPESILDDSDDITQTTTSLLSGLPMPKTGESKSIPFAVEDDEIEEEIKQKTLQMKTKAEPPPKPAKRQPVKITIPELPQYDSDDDDMPVKKKQKVQQGKTGLFALLPSPKNFSVKTTNRPLLPYTLSKKPAAPKPKPSPTAAVKRPPTKPQPLVSGVPDADSDDEDDEEPSSFFSLNQVSAPKLNVAPAVEEPEAKVEPALQGPWQGQRDTHFVSDMDMVPNSATVGAVAGPSLPPTQDSVEAGADYAVPYSNADYNYAAYDGQQQQDDTEVQQYLQDEEFLKLAGRRRRGRETIDLIDVKADHQTSQEELTKNLTEEVPGHSYSKKRNKDLPSSQQRRKHQITYLAYQAKERELELKNQWAHNRQTKAQTQAKYGF